MKNSKVLFFLLALSFLSGCDQETVKTGESKNAQEISGVESDKSLDLSDVKISHTETTKTLDIEGEIISYSPIFYTHSLSNNSLKILDRVTKSVVAQVVRKGSSIENYAIGSLNKLEAKIIDMDKAFNFLNMNKNFDFYLEVSKTEGKYLNVTLEDSAPKNALLRDFSDAPFIPRITDAHREKLAKATLRYGKENNKLHFIKKVKRTSNNSQLVEKLPSINILNATEEQFKVETSVVIVDSVHSILRLRIENTLNDGAFIITNPMGLINENCKLSGLEQISYSYRDTNSSIIAEALVTNDSQNSSCLLSDNKFSGVLYVYDINLNNFLMIEY